MLSLINTSKLMNAHDGSVETENIFSLENCHIDELMSNNIFDIINIDDYIETITLLQADIQSYSFNPKKLAHDLYQSSYLGSFILHINKLDHPGDFDLAKMKTMKIINTENMKKLLLSVNRRLQILKG